MKNTWKKWMAVTCAMMMTICPLAVTAASAEEDTVVTVETLKLATPTDLQPVAVPEETVEEPAAETAEETVGQSAEETVKEPVEEPTEEVTENVVSSENETELVDIEEYETPLGIDRSVGKEQKEKLVVTALADTDVRTRADGLSKIFLTLAEGTELNVLGVEGDWIAVAIDEETIGYVYVGDVQGLPEEMTPEKEEEPEDPTANMKVTIFTSQRRTVYSGEPITLSSRIEGFDGYEIRYQWECDKHDGSGFQDVNGANDGSYSFYASEESLSWDWRLSVYF